MKVLKLLFICFTLSYILGCDNKESEDVKNLNVAEYVSQLKEGTYKSTDLPEFSPKDIPSLLAYRNEVIKIRNFPHNAISSLYMPECSLGMYILWTIESIRAVAISGDNLVGRFPSQNPIVQQRKAPFDLKSGIEIQKEIAQKYYKWWEENKHKNFDKFKHIDPLANTKYQWH